MFKKLMSRFKSPKKSGSGGDQGLDDAKFAKVFELELSNMEGTPAYSLTHQLTIGSEIGNIVIADPSVSPRHATFILQQEVVSIIDHSSVAGTFVNGKKIASGKYIILEESDVVAVGDLEVRIKVHNEAFPEETVGDEPPSDDNLPEYEPAKPAGEANVNSISDPKLTGVTQRVSAPEEKKVVTFKVQSTANAVAASQNAVAKAKKKSKFKLGFASYHSANTLIRLMAIGADLLLSYTLVEILIPFDDFKTFIAFVPEAIFNLIQMQPADILSIIFTEVPEAKKYWDEFVVLIPETLSLAPVIITFFIVRLSTTLLFGVSISEFMFGMRAIGNGIWNRIGGVIRVVLGVITGPLIIFDIPALFSRRTFKEFMTFTNTDADSRSLTFFGVIFYFPLLLAFLLVSPLLQGLEIPEPIIVSAKIDKRVKVVPKEGEVPVTEVALIAEGSKDLGFSLNYPQSSASIVPDFKFSGRGNGITYQVAAIFYMKELQRPVRMELFKKFDLKDLINVGLKANFMLFEKYPELYRYTHETTDKSFYVAMTPDVQETFAKEFMNYTRLSFGLSIDNIVEVAQTETFIFKNLVDFKHSLLGLLENKTFSELDLAQIGDAYFFRANYPVSKPYDLIVPLTKGPGRVFKISFDKKEKMKELSTKFYKFVMEQSNWLNPTYPLETEKFTAFETVDFFSKLDKKNIELLRSKSKSVYGFYFELSADIIRRSDQAEYGILKKSVDDVSKIIQMVFVPVNGSATPEDAIIVKKFNDLKSAVEGKNMNFFGLEQNI